MSVDPSELNANAAEWAAATEPVNPTPPTTVEVMTGLPVAEPGTSTSEWKASIAVFATNTTALAVSFGVPLSPTQQTVILAWVGSTTALVGIYMAGRSIRKKGTTS